MNLNENSNRLRGQHALFSPSQPSWLNYNSDEFVDRLVGKYRSDIGTEIHAWSSVQIELGHKMSSQREIVRSIETYIYEKYYSDKYGLSDYGSMLLKCLRYVQADTIETVKAYVNDAVGFKMKTEVVLVFTDNFFGTCDAIKEDKNFVRIHDLKTGSTPAHIEQLLIYEALYCLMNDTDPFKLSSELRIYQNNDILIVTPEPSDIVSIMDKIRKFDQIMTKFKGGLL